MADTSHREIVKSTAVIGGSQVLSIGLGAVSTKVLAMLLGPAGVGVIGLLSAPLALVSTVFGLGIRTSGVRQIAAAMGEEDVDRVGRVAAALRRISLLTGLLGSVVFAALAFPLSRLTFGDWSYGYAFLLLSVGILLTQVSAGQTALIQGMRRIGNIARLTVLGSLFSTIASIPLVVLLGVQGIAPYMVATSAMSLAASWWYVRKVPLKVASITWGDTFKEASPLLRLGFAFMVSAAMSTGTTYALRLVVIRSVGLAGLGLYQAAATLSSLYVGLLLSAMGQDFLPRLCAAREGEDRVRLVNEQAFVGLLVAAPGVLATLVAAPLVLRIFYSPSFSGAATVLQWQILGDFLRITAWPMGYVLVAKNRGTTFFLTELSGNILLLSLSWAGVKIWGVEGLGVGFLGMYAAYWLIMYVLLRSRYGFSWSRDNLRLWAITVPTVVAVFLASRLLASPLSEVLGGMATVALGVFCIYRLNRALGESVFALLYRQLRLLVPRRKTEGA